MNHLRLAVEVYLGVVAASVMLVSDAVYKVADGLDAVAERLVR